MIKRILLLFLLTGFVFAQTTKWQISWDANVEPDMSHYTIFRDTVAVASILIDSVQHPTITYTDSLINNGITYYYRLQAVDLDGYVSDFSAEVSAAIPNIIQTSFTFQNQTANRVAFTDLFIDPDNSNAEMTITPTSQINVAVTMFNDSLIIAPSPLTFIGSASFTLQVSDPSTFNDIKTILVDFTSTIPATPTNVVITPNE